MRDWAHSMAEKAERKRRATHRVGRRANREKELFALRDRYVRALFDEVTALAAAVNKELGDHAIKTRRTLNAKNLGGVDVPDGARLAVEFLDRRLEIVVQPVASVGGRPAPLGPLATASVIQYDRLDPTGADWFDVSVLEDGVWRRRAPDERSLGHALTDIDLRALIEWVVS